MSMGEEQKKNNKKRSAARLPIQHDAVCDKYNTPNSYDKRGKQKLQDILQNETTPLKFNLMQMITP